MNNKSLLINFKMTEKKDSYFTIEEESIGEFRDRGSKFIAYAYPVYSESEWQDRLLEVKKSHPKARHHCYAYRIGLDKNNFRANDDGEPSGTAGRPILGQIDSFNLSNVIIIVIRYFGGTKLGTSGLINAYKTCAAQALKQASIVEKLVEDVYELEFDYALMSQVMNTIKSLQLEMLHQDFGHAGQVSVAIRQSEVEETLKKIKAGVAEVRIEEIDKIEQIDGFQINFLETR